MTLSLADSKNKDRSLAVGHTALRTNSIIDILFLGKDVDS